MYANEHGDETEHTICCNKSIYIVIIYIVIIYCYYLYCYYFVRVEGELQHIVKQNRFSFNYVQNTNCH